ncbi:hypothetical protein [Schaalia vaccimaxillae]|uniref:hypothetical protein n=1 Tax=Schaalia vaccimaxillae TaxID=183916 RepID=UPI001FB0640C|nr:hypothetical protein [Schaalia vaccimaxillae]
MTDAQAMRQQNAHNQAIEKTTNVGHLLTQTAITGIGGLDDLDTAFSIDETGLVEKIPSAAPIAATYDVQGEAGYIDLDLAQSHHLLLTTDEVDPSELEALAVSVWDDAGWVSAGDLRLTSDARLLGPWRIDQKTRSALTTPANLTNAWVVHCPQTRGSAPEEALVASDNLAQAFPEGMPVGLEYRVLLTLTRMARRLAAGIRISGSGHFIEPDPDSAVSLNVYTPRWIAPVDLIQALKNAFADVRDVRDVAPPPVPAKAKRADVQKIEKLRADLGPVRHDIATKIAKARAETERRAQSAQPQVVDGYAVIAKVGNRSDMMIEVRTVPRPPRVLRWESWTTGTIVEYQLRWLPGGTMDIPVTGLSRTARLERMRSTESIEKAAGIVVSLVGGSVVDEDGFLVGLEQN